MNSNRSDDLAGRLDDDRVSRHSVKLFKERRALARLSSAAGEALGLVALSLWKESQIPRVGDRQRPRE
jgi:hypothetical protein